MTTLTCTCDMCFVYSGRYVEAEHQRIRVKINATSGVLDLCDAHYNQLLGPVLDSLADSQQDDRHRRYRGRTAGPFQCLVPDCVAAPLKHQASMWQHVKGVHKLTLDEYRKKYGDLVPLTPDELAEIVVKVECPLDGCRQVYSTELGHRWPRAALTSHLRGRHGLFPDGKTPIGA